MENLGTFVERLSNAIGCHHHPTRTGDRHTLKKNDTMKKRDMCAFAWVEERKSKDLFVIGTYKCWADTKAITDKDYEKPRMHWEETGLGYYVSRGSTGKDYQKAVRALRVIMKNKC
jgi:hypothetical protein